MNSSRARAAKVCDICKLHMPHRLCPQCRQPGRYLDGVSTQAAVDYYRCNACDLVWTHTKLQDDDPPNVITRQPGTNPDADG